MPELDDSPTEEEERIEETRKELPSAEGMLLVQDFEDWAEKVLSGTAWNYYKSAGESLPLLDILSHQLMTLQPIGR